MESDMVSLRVLQNEQPGNMSKAALGEVQTPKGDISEVLSFSGLLPEIINSRAAMCVPPHIDFAGLHLKHAVHAAHVLGVQVETVL